MQNGNAWNASLRFGPKRQNVWTASHASWFFAMGVGGALYLNELVFGVGLGTWAGYSVAEILSFILIGIGGLILIADLGKPMRFLRAIANLQGSWISWGFLADMIFVVAGVIVLLAGGPAWLKWVAGAAALFVIVYPGFVMAASPSIPFWNTALVPLQFLAYAHASAAALAMGMGPGGPTAAVVTLVTFLFALALTGLHLVGARAQQGVARMAADDVGGATDFRLALALGVLLPIVLAILEVNGAGFGAGIWLPLALAAMIANWMTKLAVLRAGIYAPLF